MICAAATILGLSVAGFVFGRFRGSLFYGMTVRVRSLIVLAVIGFPFATLVLAKLLSSDMLGWLFGLTLMVYIALLPAAAIFYLGLRLGSRAVSTASPPEATSNLSVHVERGTVHASDDAPSKQISIGPSTTLRDLVALAMDAGFVPRISGGKATWIVESSEEFADLGQGGRPIGVWAQQWAEVKFVVDADISIAAHFGVGPKRLYLRYRCQTDPNAVFAALDVVHQQARSAHTRLATNGT